jgi:NAD(P)-dependent dehydrogenase (short-subunit alcohol dehydrogenase family)
MTEDQRLHGMKAVVTGAAGGIGEAVSLLFAKHGAEVLAVDLPDSGLEQAFRRRDSIITLPQDVTAGDATDVITEAVAKRLGGLDILVNSAGVCPVASVESLTDEDWQRAMDVNVTAMFRLCRAAVPFMRKSPAGRIINVGSVMSAFGAADMAAYAASKHAVAGLTKTLASELGRDGITANFLQPGAIVTSTTRQAFRADREFRDFWIHKSASGRLGEPLDVAKVALFLASDDAAFVSGQGIFVDGGAMQST